MLLHCLARPQHTTMAFFTQHLGPDMDLKVSRKQKPTQQCFLACENRVRSQQPRVQHEAGLWNARAGGDGCAVRGIGVR